MTKYNFLDSFSKQEWVLNGHKKIDIIPLSYLFDSLLPYIKKGRYLELGCGTGILSKYICLFSTRKIIPYGVDKNKGAIIIAQKNNPKHKVNFIVKDYFNIDKNFFRFFSTISIFISKGDIQWLLLEKFLNRNLSSQRNVRIIIFSYDYNLKKIKKSSIKKFIDKIKKKKDFEMIPVTERFFILRKSNFYKDAKNRCKNRFSM